MLVLCHQIHDKPAENEPNLVKCQPNPTVATAAVHANLGQHVHQGDVDEGSGRLKVSFKFLKITDFANK